MPVSVRVRVIPAYAGTRFQRIEELGQCPEAVQDRSQETITGLRSRISARQSTTPQGGTTTTYALDAATLRLAQIWTAAKPQPPGGEEFADWLGEHGGKLDRADGPAFIEIWADGRRREEWYKQGQRDRADGPAVVETWAEIGRASCRERV